MEIQLPEVQSYLDKIKNGSITEVRLPTTEIKTGDVLTAFSPSGNNAIYLKVLASETVPLEAIRLLPKITTTHYFGIML
jgi:hypothetical protein